ncbi:MAG: hypothetical protein HKP27_04345 [Myxococcales bacterium]|nr:hypothetical protein [Myxococcales bacterium]
MADLRATREQLAGADAIAAALDRALPLRLLLVRREPRDARIPPLLARANDAGIPVRETSDASLWRLSKSDPPAEILGLVGDDPARSRAAALAGAGAAWLFVNIAYPGNTGFAVRCAEVSGADACFVDNSMAHEGKREALRASMRADRFMPVFWEDAELVAADARRAGRRILAIEDSGDVAPWEQDLRGPTLFVVGGEKHGIPDGLLRMADCVLRLPMLGFIPSYNLQAAMAMVAGERLRQLAQEHPV